MTNASQRHHDVSPAGADMPRSRQQQHWPERVMPGHLDLELRDDAAMPAPVNKAAQSSDVRLNGFAAYTPQELADHLQQLKKEFREIYSSILDEDSQSPRQVAAKGVSLLALPCCQETAYTVLVFGFFKAHVGCLARPPIMWPSADLVAAAILPAMGTLPASCGVFILPLSMSRLSHLQAKALPLAISCQLKQQCVLSAAGGDLKQ